MKKYLLRQLDDIFSEEFLVYIRDGDIDEQKFQLVMNRIEDYEKKHNIEFVSFVENYLIFKNL